MCFDRLFVVCGMFPKALTEYVSRTAGGSWAWSTGQAKRMALTDAWLKGLIFYTFAICFAF